MLLRKRFSTTLSITLVTSGLAFHTSSFAQEFWNSDLLAECPVDSPIRVSDRESIGRYTALEACSAQIVAAEGAEVQAEEGVVRIIGIDAEPLKKRQRHERRRMRKSSSGVSTAAAPAYDTEVRLAALRHNIDPLFLHAIIDTESDHRPNAVSAAGAVGLMQIMPATGAILGVDREGLFDPVRNIDAGARHLKNLQQRFGRNFRLILSAYNAGEGAVARYGNRVPPYRETQEYVARVQRKYQQLRTEFEQSR